jgi:RecB family exonuclease
MRLPPTIQPAPIPYTTPTRAGALRECLLRAAFEADPECRELAFRGPAARLGSACHAVLEAAVRGRFDNVEPTRAQETFEQVWREQIDREEASAQKSPLERHLGPAQRWPYYALKRARLFRLISDVAEAQRHSSAKAASTGGRRTEWAERPYLGFGGRLRGRADHVVEKAGQIEIEDYKTGAIFDESEEGTSEIKATYKRQMFLYAALEWDARGRWPKRARLVSLGGEHADLAVVPAEALALAEEVVALLDTYNAAVSNGQTASNLCTPSQDVCMPCPFKVMCNCFWEAASPAWKMLNTVAFIEGIVAHVGTTTSNSSTIEVDVVRGNVPLGRYRFRQVSGAQFADLEQISTGFRVRVAGARIENVEEPRDLGRVRHLLEAMTAPGRPGGWTRGRLVDQALERSRGHAVTARH